MKKLGKYQVLGLLGQGGMGRVYKVRDPGTGRVLALKHLSPHEHLVALLGHEEIRKRFDFEAGVMQKLDHRHITKILDFGEDGGGPFIVMEHYCLSLGLVLGESYRIELPCRPLPVEKAIRFARETLLGLARLHEVGIVHRDLKPFNLLLADDESIKIADFGLSKPRGEILSTPRQLVVGSPYYAAPEQEANPEGVDARADLYSMGVILYRMLTGWLPMDDPLPPSARSEGLDEEWDACILKALAADRNDRHSSAREMLGCLDRLSRRWEDKIDKVCKARRPSPGRQPSSPRGRITLRAALLKVRPRQAPPLFHLSPLWQPERYRWGDFIENPDGTVTERTTGLVWQKGGSHARMAWDEARGYIETLNGRSFAGRSTWRLPTVDELMSLLTPTPQADDYCIEPVFSRDQRWLWSADRSSFTAAWYVSTDMGYVSFQDFTCRFFVRAVAGPGRLHESG